MYPKGRYAALVSIREPPTPVPPLNKEAWTVQGGPVSYWKMGKACILGIFLAGLVASAAAQVVPGAALGDEDGESGGGSVILSDEELFGTASAPESEPAQVDESSMDTAIAEPADLVSEAEPVPAVAQPNQPDVLRLIIARPNSFSFSADQKHAWLAPLTELFLAFRMGSVSDVYVAPPDRIAALVPDSRNYSARVSKQVCRQAGRGLHMSHIVYSEYEMRSATQARLHVTIMPVGDGDEVRKVIAIDPESLDASLSDCAREICLALGVTESAFAASAVDTTLVGPNGRKAQRLGAALAWEGAPTVERMAKAADECRRMYDGDERMHLAGYAAAVMYAQAGDYEKALSAQRSLTRRLAGAYPRLWLDAARYAGAAGESDEALGMLDKAPRSAAFDRAVLMEKGRIYETAGKMRDARRAYRELIESTPTHAQAYARLIVTTLRMGAADNEIAELAAEAAAALGRTSTDLLAAAAAELDSSGQIPSALQAYRLCAEQAPDDATIVMRMAGLYEKQGSVDKAAELYAGLVQMNPTVYRDQLDRAAELYVRDGNTAKARELYQGYFDEHKDPEAGVALARLAFENGDCAQTRTVLLEVRAKYYRDPVIDSLLTACSRDTMPPLVTLIDGREEVSLDVGDNWNDEGVTAFDAEDGDITSSVRVTGSVDPSTPGVYTLTYTAIDRAGNRGEAKRTVTVTGGGDMLGGVRGAAGGEKRRSRVRLSMSIAGGAIAAGSLIAGVVFDRQVAGLQEQYDASTDVSEVDRLHDEMEQTVLYRNVCYAAGAVSCAGVAVTITIPAIRRNKADYAMNEVNQ